MYRTKDGIVQTLVHQTIFVGDAQFLNVVSRLQEFSDKYKDCSIYIEDRPTDYGMKPALIVSGWRDCTQQELLQKKTLEGIRAIDKEKREFSQFLLTKKEHPEWFEGKYPEWCKEKA